jgi:hypothetical protein
MKPKFFASVAAAGALSVAVTMLPVAHGQAMLSGYVLKQKMIYYGQITINATSIGTRIDAKELQCFVLPNRTALVFNNSNMKYCALPHEIWIDKLSKEGGRLGPVRKGQPGTYAGHKITQYIADMYRPGGSFWYQLEFSTTNDIILPRQITDDYLTLMGLPKGYGMPLSIIRHFDKNYAAPDHKKDVFLVTYEAKPASVNSALLRPPKTGYTQVKDEMEVILGDTDLNDPLR